jgi:hypothetical protein
MEAYCDITFIHGNKSEKYLLDIKSLTKELNSDIEIELLGTKNEQTSIHFMSDSSAPEIVVSIMEYLKENSCEFARGYIAGDEDPACDLYYLNKGSIECEECDSNMYEYINEMQEEEEDLPSHLQRAADLGAKSYYNTIFKNWSLGLNKIKGQQEYKKMIDEIVECSLE